MRRHFQAAGELSYLELAPAPPSRSELPLVIGLHGRGASAEDAATVAVRVAADRCRFILPNGPFPAQRSPWGGGYAWYQLGHQQAATFARSRKLVLDLIATLEARYAVPRERIALLGFSQGAVLALDVALRSERPLAGVAALSGYLYAPETLAMALRGAQQRRVLIVHGTYDDVISIDGARLARDVLEAAGLQPEYHELPIGHQISAQALELVRAFLDRALRSAQTTAGRQV